MRRTLNGSPPEDWRTRTITLIGLAIVLAALVLLALVAVPAGVTGR